MRNPFNNDELAFDHDIDSIPRKATPGLQSFVLKDLDNVRAELGIPKIESDAEVLNLSIGTYRILRGMQYIAHLRQLESEFL